jgi:hypothetical protein
MEGTTLRDADERAESPELRLKYVARFEKLLRRPQAQEVLEILHRYGRDCLPIPRRTERHYWSVSCLPSTPGKALARVNASWMELFALYADGEGIRAKFLVHLSDFTRDHSAGQGRSTNPFSNAASRRRKTWLFLPARRGHFRHQGPRLPLDRQIPQDTPRVARHPRFQPHAHEPRPERLPSESLLQSGGSHAGTPRIDAFGARHHFLL